jgi:acyl-CoA thioesterase I
MTGGVVGAIGVRVTGKARGLPDGSGGRGHRKPHRLRAAVISLLLAAAAIALWQFWSGARHDVRRIANLAASGDLIVFFGNSITQGYGVRPEEAFPALVAQALGVSFANAGVAGDTMGAGLARMERDVLPHDPRLVVVEFGGNDFLRRVPVEETLQHLEAIVATLVREGAMVVILEVTVGLGGDPYLAGYQAVADRHGAMLIPDVMRGILTGADLRVDTIHPNAKGHRLLAERVATALRPLLAEADRRRGVPTTRSSAFRLLGVEPVG